MHAYMTWHDMTIYFMFTFAFNFTFTVTVAVTVTVTVADTFIFLFAFTFRLHTHIGWPDIHIPAGCVAGLHGVKGRAEEQRTAVSFHAEGWSNQDFEHAFSGSVVWWYFFREIQEPQLQKQPMALAGHPLLPIGSPVRWFAWDVRDTVAATAWNSQELWDRFIPFSLNDNSN